MPSPERLAERDSLRRALVSAERYRRETVTLSLDAVRALLDDPADAWDESAVATAEWAAHQTTDPPRNPYDEDAHV